MNDMQAADWVAAIAISLWFCAVFLLVGVLIGAI